MNGFLDKNRDTLFDDFKRLLYGSSNPIIAAMWPEGEKSVTSVTRRPVTAGIAFRNSMIALSTLLAAKVGRRSDAETLLTTRSCLALATVLRPVHQTERGEIAECIRSSLD